MGAGRRPPDNPPVTLGQADVEPMADEAVTLTRRQVRGFVGPAFDLLGTMDRRELGEMLAAHGAPHELLQLVEERLPADVRARNLRDLWTYLEELPLGRPEAESDNPLLQTGEVAERTGLSLRTVRYYDEMGLARPSARSEAGYRLYSEADVARLELLKRMKSLGLSLDEMREVAKRLEEGEHPELLSSAEAEQLANELQAVAERGDERIARLERDLAQARELRLRFSEQIGRCR
jgi:DNA-binding transcriptional MerR regulator